MYRFLLTSRWLTLSVLALLAIPFCLFMGTWQLSRFDAQVEQQRNAQHNEQQTATTAPVPLRDVLPDTGATVYDDDFGRIVSATGRYDAAHQYLVPSRTLDDRDGFYVLTPLRLSSGAALPVVRGWLPGDASAAEKAGTVPAPPTGQVTVDGAVQYPETTDTAEAETGQLPSGQLGIISAASLVNVLPYPVYSGWVTATHPAAPLQAVPQAADPNSGLDLKAFQNLGYTGEWFVFAAFVVFMWFRLVRREAEARSDVELGLVPDDADDATDAEAAAAAEGAEAEGAAAEGAEAEAEPAAAG